MTVSCLNFSYDIFLPIIRIRLYWLIHLIDDFWAAMSQYKLNIIIADTYWRDCHLRWRSGVSHTVLFHALLIRSASPKEGMENLTQVTSRRRLWEVQSLAFWHLAPRCLWIKSRIWSCWASLKTILVRSHCVWLAFGWKFRSCCLHPRFIFFR